MVNATEHHGAGGTPAARRTMWADTTQLYASAHTWEWEVSVALSVASGKAGEGVGQGRLFGLALAPLGRQHDAFVEHVLDLLRTATGVAQEMGSGLRSTADDWRRTDRARGRAPGPDPEGAVSEAVDLPCPLAFAGSSALLLFSTPDEWVDGVEGAIDKVVSVFHDAVDAAARRIEHLDDVTLARLGLLATPLGPLLTSSSDHARNHLLDRLSDAARTVGDELQRLWDDVHQQVDDLLGDPARLVDLGSSYLAGKAALDDAAYAARTEDARLDRYWGGDGSEAYVAASRTQVAAVVELASRLEGAAGLMSEAAATIKQVWSRLVQAVLGLAKNLVGVLASCFDVGNAIAFEVGPAVNLIGVCVGFLSDASAPVREAGAAARTTGVFRWEAVDGSSDVLAGGRGWPTIGAQDRAEVGRSGLWHL